MPNWMFIVLLAVFLSYLNQIFSLYEDQAGLIDWHQEYIGKVKQAVFHSQKAGRNRVIVSTEENIIASLDLRHGEIFWRHIFGLNDAIDAICTTLGKYVITLSSGGSILRAWNLPDGQMVWESSLEGTKASKSLLLNFRIDSMLVYGSESLYAVSSIDGEIHWKTSLGDESIEVHQIIQPLGGENIYAVGFSAFSHIVAYQVHSKTGELLNQQSSSFSGSFSGDVSLVSNDMLVALDSSRSILVSISFRDGEINFRETRISNLLEDFSGTAIILPSNLCGMFSLKINTLTLFLKVTDEGEMQIIEKANYALAFSDAVLVAERQHAFALVQHSGDKINLAVKRGHDWNNDFLKENIEMDNQRGLVHNVFINKYIRTDKSHGFRSLIVMEDHSLLLVQQGVIVWCREDGLASIIDVTTSELPVEKKGVSVARVEQTLFEWLRGHMLKLKGTLMLATPEDVASIQQIKLQSSGKGKMTRDRNGFRKLLIVLTKPGKVFALHTGDGRIIWSLLLQSLCKSKSCNFPIGPNVYQWKVPHFHGMDENPSVLIVGKCAHSSHSLSILSFVDTYTGKELDFFGLSYSIVQVIPIPYTDATEQRLHLLIDADKCAHLYPRNSEALDILKREYSNIYWYSIEADIGIIRGRVLKNSCVVKVDDKFCFGTRVLWSIVFPLDSEKIIATVSKNLDEVVHTQAKVIADQDVMYKYVSKNMFFVATASPKGSGEIGSATPDESRLVVYIIDSVTGRILHRVTHHGSQGPVHAVFSENWVVYHYFNLRAHRYEMSVIEIFDQSRADNKDVLKLVIGKHNLTSPISSYSKPEILTKSQSYFFAHSVKTIAVTSTAKGITSKQLLIGTLGDQVLALDKRFLDPRRSLNPSQAEKEEGIIPLTDSLPIIPQSYVTHALRVLGLRGIVTMAAKLESNALVFAYGVDVFFTRTAPSRTYDSLTDDFGYALLLITIAVLVLAICVTWVLSERKELQEKWR